MLVAHNLEDYLDKPLDQLALDLRSASKKRAGDITLRELAASLERPNGVYAFYDQPSGGNCLYVGKVSSQSYIARIAMHFDPREESWMNQFVRKLRDSSFASAYDKAQTHGLEQYVVFLGFVFVATDDKLAKRLRSDRINALEGVLRAHLSPRLNTKQGTYDGKTLVKDLLPTQPSNPSFERTPDGAA